ncbi:MAG: sulfite exporter TauE/SafE family protein [Parachlamydiaceae bacterium]
MSLLMAMLPIYLFGNLHCLGMCGPLVMMIGQHRYRYFYFFGRILSFSLAGMTAGAVGAVADIFFREYHFAEATTFLFGGVLIVLGCYTLLGWSYPGYQWLSRRFSGFNHTLSLLMLRDSALATFLFGFFTIALPCGQTLVVFSACALSASFEVGLLNGFVFALLTSPSLFFAMQAHVFLRQARHYYRAVVGISALIVGIVAVLRGLAEEDFIPHFILNPNAAAHYHIVIY